MDISYNELKSKEIINLADGKKLGHVIDVIFDSVNGKVRGIVVPGEKKFFRKSEDIFIPLEKVRKIGDDVVLIRYENSGYYVQNPYPVTVTTQNARIMPPISQSRSNGGSYIRYRPLNNNKYK
ncbi:MAG: YlmC/YmxH family sporulation protein [Clostridiales bacterium]|nr:YlmC/YmxH family sporulation protein [Clostridiales bacterium]